MIRALKRHGYFVHHQNGSHVYLDYLGNRDSYVCVPNHPGDLSKLTLKSILHQAGIDVATLLEWL